MKYTKFKENIKKNMFHNKKVIFSHLNAIATVGLQQIYTLLNRTQGECNGRK